MPKYLYVERPLKGGVLRFEILREENKYWYIKTANITTRVSRRTNRQTANKKSLTAYQEETPELLAEWNSQEEYINYLKKLHKLRSCTDEKVIKMILDIEI